MEETILDELEQRGYILRKVVKSTQECTKLVVDDQTSRYFVRCYSLKELFRTSETRKLVNNELNMAENFKKSDLNTCVQFVKRLYTKHTLFMFFVYHRHITLETLLSTKALGEAQKILVLRDLLAILYELRGVGVLHRHLSPDKILVTGSQLKFCSIKYCTPVQKPKYDTDEYLYMLRNQTNLFSIPPEVLFNEFTGFKTQIFSFGVIVYLLFHQHYPFPAISIDDLKNLYKTSLEKPQIDLRLKEELVYMLQKSLQLNYNDRMSLSEVKLRVGELYKEIVAEEESIRQKLYNIMNPAIKIDDSQPLKQSLKELLFVLDPKKPPQVYSLPAISRKKNTRMIELPLEGLSMADRTERGQGSGAVGDHNISDLSSNEHRREPAHISLLAHRAEKLLNRPLLLDLPGANHANSKKRLISLQGN